MTTIAYKDGILASDSQCWKGDIRIGYVRKIIRLKDRSLLAVAGNLACLQSFAEWLNGGRVDRKPSDHETTIVHVRLDGSVWVFEHDGEMRSSEQVAAWGSGHVVARTAMECGLSAPEAVRMAVKFDGWSGGPVRSLRLP